MEQDFFLEFQRAENHLDFLKKSSISGTWRGWWRPSERREPREGGGWFKGGRGRPLENFLNLYLIKTHSQLTKYDISYSLCTQFLSVWSDRIKEKKQKFKQKIWDRTSLRIKEKRKFTYFLNPPPPNFVHKINSKIWVQSPFCRCKDSFCRRKDSFCRRKVHFADAKIHFAVAKIRFVDAEI